MLFEISYPIILVSLFASFMSTLLVIPYWIKRAKNAGLKGKDINKPHKPEVAEMGGITVVMGFVLAILLYIAIDTFYIKHLDIEHFLMRDLQIVAALLSIALISIIGIVDDILGWKIGLRQWQKPILIGFAALPMVVVNAGHSNMMLPLIGDISIGVLYPLIVIPIAISGAANGFNMLAGYNGLEAGMGAIILGALGYVAWITDFGWVAVMAFCMVSALLAFYIFNKYPAKIFPGDTLTYTVGGLIAIIAILANLERLALIIFIPYFIEFILKMRGMFRKESFAKVNKDGSLAKPYKKFYGLEHVAIAVISKIKRKAYEKDVVYALFAMQLMVIFIAFIIRG